MQIIKLENQKKQTYTSDENIRVQVKNVKLNVNHRFYTQIENHIGVYYPNIFIERKLNFKYNGI